jgi:hypothetical protein
MQLGTSLYWLLYTFIYFLLFRDNVPTIVLNQWEITADYLEDDLLDGVMPVLFADDVKAAEAAIYEAPLTAKRDLEEADLHPCLYP